MTEIKRYGIDPYLERPLERILIEHPEGDWVRWDDVKEIVERLTNAEKSVPRWFYEAYKPTIELLPKDAPLPPTEDK